MPDILFILLLALVIFGPKKLPEIARQIAKYMAQFLADEQRFQAPSPERDAEDRAGGKQAPAKLRSNLPATNQPIQTESQPQLPFFLSLISQSATPDRRLPTRFGGVIKCLPQISLVSRK